MENEVFLKKVYSAAYMLTGKEKNACEMASLVINKSVKNLIPNNQMEENIFKSTIIELVDIFLNTQNICYNDTNDDISNIQEALLSLNPIRRAVIVWKDVLGFRIDNNMPAANYTRQELLIELSLGRRELKNILQIKTSMKR